MEQELFENEREQSKHQDTLIKHLTFASAGLHYAIDANYVIEIITDISVTLLPKVPDFIMGIMNLRGQIVPVVDFRIRMGKESAENLEGACIIVIEVNGVTVGVYVDGVTKVVDLEMAGISPPPSKANQELISGIIKIDGIPNLLLDCEKLVEAH